MLTAAAPDAVRDLQLDLARQALERGDAALALQTLADILTADPVNAAAIWEAGRYYGRQGAFADAAEYFAQALKLDATLSVVEFAFAGQIIRLRDVEGSAAPIQVLRELERDPYELRTRRFAPGDVVVDVGAHIGTVSIILALLHPEIRVIACEPASRTFAMLLANLEANGVRNVTPVQAAIMGTSGTCELVWAPTQSVNASTTCSASSRSTRVAAGWQQETVAALTLDDLFTRQRLERCAFLKLDCEGAEWAIVAGARALERVTAAALELHLPASRQAEGEAKLQQEFSALLTRRARWPETKVPSSVWVLDG
ncbi:MAG: FkbM family methyltransferase [Gemmatimonadales bacterium]